LKVRDAGVGDLLRLGEAYRNRAEREGQKELFHVRLQRLWRKARTAAARGEMIREIGREAGKPP
jgi:hypothetical protein